MDAQASRGGDAAPVLLEVDHEGHAQPGLLVVVARQRPQLVLDEAPRTRHVVGHQSGELDGVIGGDAVGAPSGEGRDACRVRSLPMGAAKTHQTVCAAADCSANAAGEADARETFHRLSLERLRRADPGPHHPGRPMKQQRPTGAQLSGEEGRGSLERAGWAVGRVGVRWSPQHESDMMPSQSVDERTARLVGIDRLLGKDRLDGFAANGTGSAHPVVALPVVLAADLLRQNVLGREC